MPRVITETCSTESCSAETHLSGKPCVEACPLDAIHPRPDEPQTEAVTQLYVDPDNCMDCGACSSVCPSDSIRREDELPAGMEHCAGKNAAYYAN